MPIRIQIRSMLILASITDIIHTALVKPMFHFNMSVMPRIGLVANYHGECGLAFKHYADFCQVLHLLHSFLVSRCNRQPKCVISLLLFVFSPFPIRFKHSLFTTDFKSSIECLSYAH